MPISSPDARRVENRIPGMDVNPYLGIAASLACGYLGLKEKKLPREAFAGDAYKSENELPVSLGEALERFDESAEIQQVLGQSFCRAYSAVKSSENKEFLQVISPWEREHLLLNV